MLINQDIKNFVQGISQQPPTLRDAEQLEEQLNGFSSEASGLQKRPPTLFISKLHKYAKGNKPLVHFIDRDTDEKYIVLLTGSDLEVYDMQGNKKTVNFAEDTKSYIYTASPRQSLKLITIADYTFICNTKQPTKMADTIDSSVWDTQGLLVNIKSGQYGRTYRVDINGSTIASYETPDGSDKSHTKRIATDYIASQLASAAITNGYTAVTGSSWVYITKTGYKTAEGDTVKILAPSTTPAQQYDRFKGLAFTASAMWVGERYTTVTLDKLNITVQCPSAEWSATCGNTAQYNALIAEVNRCKKDYWTVTSSTSGDYEIYKLTWTSSSEEIPADSKPYSLINSAVVYDGYNNQAAFGIMQSTQKFTNLPATAPDGFTTKINGEKGSKTDDYYVSYVAADQVWRECARPALKNHIDNTTMPHVLVREADGTFTFKCADWSSRDVGDDDSNPAPSFIGQTVNEIFYHRNRLGFLSGENVILTRSADFFNFWMTSAMEIQDTDPIDLAVSDNKIATLHHAISFDAELIVFSKDAQFALKADNVLSPKDAILTPAVTHFGCSLKATPVNAGRNIYFTAERSEFTTVREFFIAADNTDSKDAQDITSHVPSYIPNGVYKIIPSNVENIMLFLTEGEEEAVYVYKYLFIDSVRQQAAWSKWTFGDTIYGGAFIDGYLYLIIERNNELCLECMSFTFNTEDYPDAEPYRVLLDSKRIVNKDDACIYDSNKDETTINIKAIYGDCYDVTKTYSVVCADGTYATANKNGEIILSGNFMQNSIICGINYNFRIVLSTIYVKQDTDCGVKSMLEGRLQLRQLWFNYADSGYFKVYVNVFDKEKYEYINSQYVIGTGSTKLGKIAFETGQFKVPVQSLNTNCEIILETDAPAPISLIGAGWIGNYIRRTRQF